MQKRVDPAVELAAKAIQSEPWDLSHWWQPLVFMAASVKHECCFRDWSEAYPGSVGDRDDFICGECSQRGPVARVLDPITGAEGIREASDLGFCSLDPFCDGARLKPASCASVFADRANDFCDRLDRTLVPDSNGSISQEKAHEAYWAFSHFRKHLPDWDPTGAYDGAFERWGADCARANLPAWGPEGPPKLVPLVDRILQEREEALAGAQRAYTGIMVPARTRFHTGHCRSQACPGRGGTGALSQPERGDPPVALRAAQGEPQVDGRDGQDVGGPTGGSREVKQRASSAVPQHFLPTPPSRP